MKAPPIPESVLAEREKELEAQGVYAGNVVRLFEYLLDFHNNDVKRAVASLQYILELK
jgi:hypothetical protein